MKWLECEPNPGDIIRVKVKFYRHYGLFISDNEIIQFGMPDNTGTPSEDIAVISTDIDTFLNGGILECASLSLSEKLKRRKTEEIIDYARSQLGTKGYKVLENNCAHFVLRCAFKDPAKIYDENLREDVKSRLKKNQHFRADFFIQNRA